MGKLFEETQCILVKNLQFHVARVAGKLIIGRFPNFLSFSHIQLSFYMQALRLNFRNICFNSFIVFECRELYFQQKIFGCLSLNNYQRRNFLCYSFPSILTECASTPHGNQILGTLTHIIIASSMCCSCIGEACRLCDIQRVSTN